MTPNELYGTYALECPAVRRQQPEWNGVSVHAMPKIEVICDPIDCCLSSSEITMLAHSERIGVILPKGNVVTDIAEQILKHDIQASKLQLTDFVTVSRYGVATDDVTFSLQNPSSLKRSDW